MIYTNNIIYDLWSSLITGSKATRSGFTTFNGPCCIHNRQPRPDTSKRAGIRLNVDNSAFYHCFNCAFACGWSPGQKLSKKNRDLLTWWNVSEDEIKKLNFQLWQQAEIQKMNSEEEKPKWFPSFGENPLPPNSKTLQEWVNLGENSENFISTLEYLLERGDHLCDLNEYYWSNDFKFRNRLIIPFYWNEKITGWTGRLVKPNPKAPFKEVKYLSEFPHNYLFNNKVMYDHRSKFLLITEGPFDALSIGGIAVLRNNINQDQINWINSTGKTVVVVPDQVKSGYKLIEIAIKNNWLVSFPNWENDIKDASDAVKRYGKLFTLYSILKKENLTSDELKANVWFKLKTE